MIPKKILDELHFFPEHEIEKKTTTKKNSRAVKIRNFPLLKKGLGVHTYTRRKLEMNDIDKNRTVEKPCHSSIHNSFLIRLVVIIFVIVCIIFFVCWVTYIVLVGYVEPMAMFIPRSVPLISTELDEQIRLQTKSIPNGYMFSLYPTYTPNTPRRALVVFHGNGGLFTIYDCIYT